MRYNLLRASFHQDHAVMNDIGAVHDIEGIADIVVGDEDAEAAVLQVNDEVANFGDGNVVDSGQGLVQQNE